MQIIMKHKIFLAILALGTGAIGFSQTLTMNAESGNRSTDQANCWEYGAVGYTNTAAQVISGSWSMRGNSLSNPSLDACWIKSPWVLLANGNITLRVKMENTSGTGGTPPNNYKMVSVRFREFDPNASSFQGAYVGGTQDYLMVAPFTTTQNVSFRVPAELVAAGKPLKVMISFSGVGGNNRPNIDDIVIPGTYFSDPANRCLPIQVAADKDGDGVKDDDDAYPDDKERAFNSYLPTEGFNTLMFEDLWPGKGDFDFNDLVVDYQMKLISNAKNELVDLVFTYKVKAIGAAFKNGLGVELRNIKPSQVFSVKGNSLKTGIHKIAANGLEEGTESLTFIAFDNAFDLLPYAGGGVTGVNTTVGAPAQKIRTETVVINFLQDGKSANGTPVMVKEIRMDQFNPFMIVNQKRGVEIHLPDMPPTALADRSLFGTKEDASSEGSGRWYKTKNNFLPWALNVSMEVPYPIEKVSLEKAYPYFAKWAQSNGSEYADWYIEKYRENGALYK
jgi:LruC domain-containing protein